jgi:hypothetical protein
VNAAAAYYLIPSRFWELLLGGLGALFPSQRLGLLRIGWLPEIGLAMLLAAIFLFDSNTAFPGIAALLPCAGSVILLLSMDRGQNDRSIVGRVLRFRPMVFIGQLSYSLYLWHWPLIVFQRIGPIIHTGLRPIYDKALVMALIFVVSYLSWALVEIPLRQGVFGLSRRYRAIVILSATAAACVLFASPLTQSGFPGRFAPGAIKLASYLSYDPSEDYRTGTCFLTNKSSFSEFNRDRCLAADAGDKTVLLVGDSHAADLYAGLKAALGKRVSLLQATATGCKPVLRDAGTSTTCAAMTGFIYNDYLIRHPVDLVVISARWSDDDVGPLAATVRQLKAHGQAVAIMGPTPEFTQPLPRLLAQRIQSPRKLDLQNFLYPGPRELDRKLATMAEREGAIYISLYDKLCPHAQCISTVDNAPLYFDASHLTKVSSIFLAGQLTEFRILD